MLGFLADMAILLALAVAVLLVYIERQQALMYKVSLVEYMQANADLRLRCATAEGDAATLRAQLSVLGQQIAERFTDEQRSNQQRPEGSAQSAQES